MRITFIPSGVMPEVTQCRVKTFIVVCACVTQQLCQPSFQGQWRPQSQNSYFYPTVMRYPPLKYPQYPHGEFGLLTPPINNDFNLLPLPDLCQKSQLKQKV